MRSESDKLSLLILRDRIPAVKTVEEGELSEGEFEDNPPKQSSAYQGVARVVRSPAQALTDSYGRSLDLQRQRSESYSPPDYNDDYEPALEPGQSQHKFREQNHNAGWPTTNSPADTHSSKFTKSLLNARKEAQGAILNLLPLKIRFQNYVEEGIDPEVVRRQFEAIGLAPSSQSIDAPDLTTAHVSPRIMNSRPADSFIVPQQDGNAGPKSVHTTGEERKDRIARLLAEKTRKLSSLTSSADSVNKLSSAETTAANKAAAASQISAKADKERMLRLKMEALQKSREQRAQKAATKVSVPQPTSPLNISTSNAATAHRQDSSAAPQPTRQSLTPSVSEPVPVQDHNSAKPIAPSIPGLFLSASRNTPSPLSASEITSAVSQVVNPRKRPVASDFDVPPSAVQAYKRPFGHNRNDQPLVIDVSDDESDDGEQDDVDVVYPHSNINAFLGAFHNGAGSQKMSAMRDLPPLSDFPTRKHFTTPASGVSTPPATQSQAKSFTGKPEDLLRKEMEIEEMKRKIAEAERRKKAKQANSGSQTPGREEIKSSPMKPAAATSLPSTVDTSIQIELLIDDATRQINNDQEKLIITHAVEQARVDDLKRAQLDQRRLRRAKIASDLPAVDAEVEKSRKRLADLRAEVAQLEAAVQQGLDQKKILAEEMERLGQEADEQLQAQKNKLDYLRREEESNSVHHDDAGMEEESDNYEAATHLRKSPTAPTNSSKVSDNEEEEENGSDRQTHLVADMVPDRALDETFQDSSVRSDATRDSDIEDFYAPDPHELPSISSDSPTSPKQSDDRLAATDTDKAADSAVGESDHYEPPEATPSPMDTSSSGSAASSPVPPDDVSSTDRTDLQAVDSSVLAFTDIVSANHTASNPELAPQKVEGTEVYSISRVSRCGIVLTSFTG